MQLPPDVVIIYGNDPDADGVPEIVKVPVLKVTPAGNEPVVTEAPVAPPPTAYTILVNGVLIHNEGEAEPDVTEIVEFVFKVLIPEIEAEPALIAAVVMSAATDALTLMVLLFVTVPATSIVIQKKRVSPTAKFSKKAEKVFTPADPGAALVAKVVAVAKLLVVFCHIVKLETSAPA